MVMASHSGFWGPGTGAYNNQGRQTSRWAGGQAGRQAGMRGRQESHTDIKQRLLPWGEPTRTTHNRLSLSKAASVLLYAA